MIPLLETMLEGTGVSLAIFSLTLLLSIPLALPVAFARRSHRVLIRGPVSFYVLIMRGTPLILQLLFVYFAPYYLFRLSYDRFIAVIIAFSLNYAAYFAEIYRGGIDAIPRGRWEAARSLGLTSRQVFFKVILPQVTRRILPAMGNEVITLVKDTALAQTIGVAELFRAAQNASARQFSTVPIFIAGLFYFGMNWFVTVMFAWIEKKLGYYKI
ncbi:MAG: amino acid ABC transporter permease [Treponemataceae bacterium]|nr:amino acid ABC transporter permease [Treponemataceae bacterium]